MARLTPAQIYQTARDAGFPPDTAVKMTAIALRESGGQPDAFNGVGPDQSYGLWQINMIGDLGKARMGQLGLTDPAELFDPTVNAEAAYKIWGGNDANLDTAWYIERNPAEAAKYQANLPIAQAAAEAVDGGTSDESGVIAPQLLVYAGLATLLGLAFLRE